MNALSISTNVETELKKKNYQPYFIFKIKTMTTKNLLWIHQPAQEKVTTARSQDLDKHEQEEEH